MQHFGSADITRTKRKFQKELWLYSHLIILLIFKWSRFGIFSRIFLTICDAQLAIVSVWFCEMFKLIVVHKLNGCWKVLLRKHHTLPSLLEKLSTENVSRALFLLLCKWPASFLTIIWFWSNFRQSFRLHESLHRNVDQWKSY